MINKALQHMGLAAYLFAYVYICTYIDMYMLWILLFIYLACLHGFFFLPTYQPLFEPLFKESIHDCTSNTIIFPTIILIITSFLMCNGPKVSQWFLQKSPKKYLQKIICMIIKLFIDLIELLIIIPIFIFDNVINLFL